MQYWAAKDEKKMQESDQFSVIDSKVSNDRIKLFDIDSLLKLSKQDKQNLILIKIFSEFNWITETRQIRPYDCFGEEAFVWSRNERRILYKETIRPVTKTVYMVTIHKEAFRSEVNRIENNRITLRSRYIQRIPLFKGLKFSKSKLVA